MKDYSFSVMPLLLRFVVWAAWLNSITVATIGKYERSVQQSHRSAFLEIFQNGVEIKSDLSLSR